MGGFFRQFRTWFRDEYRVRPGRSRLGLEQLEDRVLPALVYPTAAVIASGALLPSVNPGSPAGFHPSQIRHAYGFDRITFANGTIQGDGSGQTIAIVDAFDQPNIANDLAAFDATFGLPNPPSFIKVDQDGAAAYPAADRNWGLEISLDVEWAHAIAPGANILLVEANSATWSDLLTAVNYARNVPGVSVVSMSWGSTEWAGETANDGFFTTPSGHNGVTFVASSGDNGSTGGPEAPSASPYVLAVGGTQLSVDGTDAYFSETAWSGSGGGVSAYESQPSYQAGISPQVGAGRAVPDVAYNGSSASPFAVYDTASYGGWLTVYGTSAGAPQWAALIAIANQGRVLAGKGALDGATQTLPLLYQLPSTYFHDVTTGGNGAYSAGPGYDLVTGLGSPLADHVVSGLVGPDWNSGYLVALYRDILRRDPAQSEITGWLGALSVGVSRDQIVQAFLHSTEYLNNIVRDDYSFYLNRSASSDEVAGWVSALRSGMSHEELAAAFLQSTEYFQSHGGTFNGWLAAVYQGVLNRPVDSAGLATWSGAQAAGFSLGQIALGVLTSQEFDYSFTNAEYQIILQRPADAGGLNSFVGGLGRGLGWEDVIAAMYSSAEFFQRNSGG